MDSSSAYYFFIGWSIILIAFFGMNKFEGTRTILYYLLWLLVVLDIVTHYKELEDILSKAGFQTTTFQPLPTNVAGQLTGGGSIHGTGV